MVSTITADSLSFIDTSGRRKAFLAYVTHTQTSCTSGHIATPYMVHKGENTSEHRFYVYKWTS